MLIENALRWVAVAHIDDNVCEPCKNNDGKLYRNRQAAYRDYPNGKSYVKCVGAEFGNECRCKVVKRGKASKGDNAGDKSGGAGATMEIGEIVNRYQALTKATSVRAGNLPASPAAKPVNLKARDVNTPQMNGDPGPGADLYLYDAIGGWMGIDPMDVVTALAGVSGPLTVHLNSPGGSIFDGAAIYDALQQYGATKGPVTARIEGVAASAASFIAMAASPYDAATETGGIETTDLGVMMIHDGMASAFGATQDDLLELADLVGMLSDNIAGVYAKRTGGTQQEWRDTMREGDNWYNAAAQIEMKLADRIAGAIPPTPDAPSIDPEPDNLIPSETTDKPAPVDYEGLRLALKGALAR